MGLGTPQMVARVRLSCDDPACELALWVTFLLGNPARAMPTEKQIFTRARAEGFHWCSGGLWICDACYHPRKKL